MFKKIRPFVFVAILMGISLLGWALQQHMIQVAQKTVLVPQNNPKPPVYDRQLLNQFQQLLAKYDSLQDNYTIAGTITATDQTDTTQKMQDVKFCYGKQGNTFDYQVGDAEIINAAGLNIRIDRDQKSLILSPQKTTTSSEGKKIVTGLLTGLQSEQYNLVSRKIGGQETISLINEHHITCKQYSVSFDTLDKKINRIYMRLTNMKAPLRKDNEKIIDMKINRWESIKGLDGQRLVAGIVKKSGNNWKAVNEYAAYRIIKM